MITRYVCPTCGYDKAVWHIRLNLSRLDLCENCYSRFQTPSNHISSFSLNTKVTRYFAVPDFVKANITHLHTLRTELGFSQNSLATLTGVPEMIIRGYECERIGVQKEQYNALAEFFEWKEWA